MLMVDAPFPLSILVNADLRPWRISTLLLLAGLRIWIVLESVMLSSTGLQANESLNKLSLTPCTNGDALRL